jgi:Transposase, Mutator family
MARRTHRPQPRKTLRLSTLATRCPAGDHALFADYLCHRTIGTLDGLLRLHVQVRRCHQVGCPRFHVPVHPEQEGSLALPHHEFGLDVVALVGALRYSEHRSVPEIRAALVGRGVAISERTVTNLLDRYDELLALSLASDERLQRVTAAQGHVVLAVDGLQPDVGHEVLWVVRDCLSGEILRASSLLSARHDDLAKLLREVRSALHVPILGVVSDGQRSLRQAIAAGLPGVPHQLCHFHYLREAARPIFEADRHAKKMLKKTVRGVRPLERAVEGRTDRAAMAVKGYCAAVRSALTDDGRPPLCASGLRLHERLTAVLTSLERAAKKGAFQPSWHGCAPCWTGDFRPRNPCGRPSARPIAGSTVRPTCWPIQGVGGSAPCADATPACSAR